MFSIKCDCALSNFYLQSRNVFCLLLYILGVQQIRVSGEILLALELIQLDGLESALGQGNRQATLYCDTSK